MPDELMVSIEKLVYGGDGLAHADGNTIFVPYVLPREEVRASTKSKKKKLIWAKLLEVTLPAKQREQPRCPHFQTCSRCHYHHNSAADSGALDVAVERCTKSPTDLAASLREALPQLESLLLLDKSKNRFELTGPGFLLQQAGGFQYRVSHLSFFQVNRFLIEELLQTMVAGGKGDLALDLYAGVGFFTLPLARAFKKVVAVDANLAAMRDLQVNAESAGVAVVCHNDHVEEFLRKTTEQPELILLDPPRSGLGAEAAAKIAALGAAAIVYLSCDPSTLARDLAALTGTGKNASAEATSGTRYQIDEMHVFDLFPQTFHIETLVRLRRAP